MDTLSFVLILYTLQTVISTTRTQPTYSELKDVVDHVTYLISRKQTNSLALAAVVGVTVETAEAENESERGLSKTAILKYHSTPVKIRRTL